jgi:RNA recognition motif-containing protein
VQERIAKLREEEKYHESIP